MQQATVNLFADMGAQPATLQSGPVATAGVDRHAPRRPRRSPRPPAHGRPTAAASTISGTASDTGGGVVAGVEVSTDGGTTWHPATGTTSWTYTWTAHGSPVDDDQGRAPSTTAATSQTPGAGVDGQRHLPVLDLWGTSTRRPPRTPTRGDADAGRGRGQVQVRRLRHRSPASASTRPRRTPAPTSAASGRTDGHALAQATFTGETASGWQTGDLRQPGRGHSRTRPTSPSYFAPNGHYAATADYFYRTPRPGPTAAARLDSPPLHALRNTGTDGNGVYNYGAEHVPANTYSAANYWVDVVFIADRRRPGR